MKKQKIVTIGGGTGSFMLLSGLRELENTEITAVVAMSDSGGSTGRLRVDMGVLPAGDIRQALVALSHSPEVLRDLFTHRYDTGEISGHTFGNLFLATLEKVSGSFEKAVAHAGKLLGVKGRIRPITLHNHNLVIERKDGTKIEGEGNIDTSNITDYTKIYLTDNPKINQKVVDAIMDADIVFIAPGNFYCSIIPNFLVEGLTEVLSKTKARSVFIANLITKKGHTDNFTVQTFLEKLHIHSNGFTPDTVVYNTQKDVSPELAELIATEGGELVALGEVDTDTSIEYIGTPLVAETLITQDASDTVQRSLLRHDVETLLKALKLKV